MEKVKLTQDYSDLNLSEKENLCQKRISRPNKLFTNYNYSSDESNENNNNNVNVRNGIISKHQEANKTLPIPPLPKTLIVTKLSKRNEMQSVKFDNPSFNRNLSKEPPVTYLDTAGKNVLPEILRRLNQIFTKLNLVDDCLCKIEANQIINNTTKKEASILEFVALPLKTHEQVQNMEKDLKDQDFFEKMVNIFFHIQGDFN